jgi:hypothetical protein
MRWLLNIIMVRLASSSEYAIDYYRLMRTNDQGILTVAALTQPSISLAVSSKALNLHSKQKRKLLGTDVRTFPHHGIAVYANL